MSAKLTVDRRYMECRAGLTSHAAAFVLAHKLREALGAKVHGEEISSDMEVDGAYFGGYVKPANHKESRRDRHLTENRSGKRRVVSSCASATARRCLSCSIRKMPQSKRSPGNARYRYPC